eukprot:gene11194-biopygen16843
MWGTCEVRRLNAAHTYAHALTRMYARRVHACAHVRHAGARTSWRALPLKDTRSAGVVHREGRSRLPPALKKTEGP